MVLSSENYASGQNLIKKWPKENSFEGLVIIKKIAKLSYMATIFFLEFPAKVVATSIMSFVIVLQKGAE